MLKRHEVQVLRRAAARGARLAAEAGFQRVAVNGHARGGAVHGRDDCDRLD
jgi:hypothetical protein